MYAEVYGHTKDGQYIGVMTTWKSNGVVFDSAGFQLRESVPFAEVENGIREVNIVSILTTGETGVTEVFYKGEIIALRAGLSTVLLRFKNGRGCITMPLRRRIPGDEDITFATQVYLVYDEKDMRKDQVLKCLSGMSVVRNWKRVLKAD